MEKKRKSNPSRGRKTGHKKSVHYRKRLPMVLSGLIVAAGLMLLFTIHFWNVQAPNNTTEVLRGNTVNQTLLAAQITPAAGYTLSFKWGDSIHKLVETGALNVANLSIILNNSGQPLTPVEKEILNGTYNGYIRFNQTNTEFVQLALWSLGINNNNTVITNGTIMHYGGSPYNLASTGGYGALGKLQLGELDIINLNSQQQALMYDVATHSYRPCCDNPTAFPDCNHGAAALGLIELLASQGANESQMYSAVREFYQYQFPQQYAEIAAYFDSHGENYSQVNSSEVMSYNFSSYSGFSNVNQYLTKNRILQQTTSGGASCGA